MTQENVQLKREPITMQEKSPHSRISFSYFFKTLLIVGFPLHVWALLMVFRDIEFVAERTEMWDAIGYAGYTMMFTLVESLILSVIVWALSLLLPRKWSHQRALSVSGSAFLVVAGASIVDMAFHAFNEARISRQYLHGLENFTSLTYALIAAAVLIGIAVSVFLILKTKWGERAFAEVFDRIILLGYFYLFLDLAGIIIVILRNVSEKI
jgi:hypothetical protein